MRSEKQFLKEDVQEKLNASDIALAFSYKNMDANLTSEFRDLIAESGGLVHVIKKRVLLKAAEEEGLSLNLNELCGHIAIMCSDVDGAVSSTKALYKFRKDNAKTIEIIGGRFQGQTCTSEDFEKISELPSQDEMRSQLLSVFEAPMSQTLSVVQSLLTSVMYCLENKASQGE